MLKWAAIFLVIAIIAALLGLTGMAGAAADIAKFLFFLFIAIFAMISCWRLSRAGSCFKWRVVPSSTPKRVRHP